MSPPLRVHAHRQGQRLELDTNLGTVDPCDLPDVFSALGLHLGLDGGELHKAVIPGAEPPDPRYPGLITLIRQARRDWNAYGDRLVANIAQLLKEGKLLPMTTANEALLQELFRDHRVGIVASLTGSITDLPRYQRLVDAGLIQSTLTRPSLIDLAFKLGHGLDMMSVHQLPTTRAQGTIENPPTLAHVIQQALAAPPLAPHEQQALVYAQTRAATYMRRPIDQSENAAERELNNAELEAVRHVTAQAIEQRHGFRRTARELRDATAEVAAAHADPDDLAAVRARGAHAVPREIADAMAQRTLQSDFDRVARTELHFAHAFGAYTKLKEQCAGAGIKDPLVYKFVAPRSCVDCRRLWGPMSKPHTYRLSYVEQREAAGGNFHLPRAEWGPVLGPVHPNCFPSGVRITTATGDVPIERIRIGDTVLTHRNRWRRVTRTMSRGRAMTMRVNGVPVTYGHPWLTGRGWITAGELMLGDELRQPNHIPRFPDTQAQRSPADGTHIRLLAGILLGLLFSRMPVSTVHLNPEFTLWKRQIDEIATDLKAGVYAYSERDETLIDELLKSRLDVARIRRSDALGMLLGDWLTAPGGVGVLHHLEPASRRAPSGVEQSSLARGPHRNSERGPAHDERVDLDTQNPRDLLTGEELLKVHLPNQGVVETEHGRPLVTSLQYHEPTQPVHNVSVEDDESYVAEGYVVHNCTEGPIQLHNEKLVAAINRTADAVLALYHR